MNSTHIPTPTWSFSFSLSTPFFLLLLFLLPSPLAALNPDGVFLLSFKYSILSDPLNALQSWKYSDDSPCSWNGVVCADIPSPIDSFPRVISLLLPNSKLLGTISPDLGCIQHLRHLNLSQNYFNGSLPDLLFNASELRNLDLSNNEIFGQLPELLGKLQSLEFLNLSDNALVGQIPNNLTSLQNLTVVSLRNNYLSGGLPTGVGPLQVLDLSSNLLNGLLPTDFNGANLQSLNLSYNRLSGEIPPQFASQIPANAAIDLSYNNLTGEIPETDSLLSQTANSFRGNANLCGKPLQPCPIPSTLSTPPPNTTTDSPPAIAAIPKTTGSSPAAPSSSGSSSQTNRSGLRPAFITAIVVGQLVAVGLIATISIFLYQVRKKRRINSKPTNNIKTTTAHDWSASEVAGAGRIGWSCLRKRDSSDEDEEDEEEEEEEESNASGSVAGGETKKQRQAQQNKGGTLVTMDGEAELELESLLKASAYILGASGSNIVYKAVLEDGTAFAVRRIGEAGLEKFRDFESQVRAIAKLRHPNLVRLRAFYWGDDEKLVIYDYAPNGSLANATYSKNYISLLCSALGSANVSREIWGETGWAMLQ
ncbi:hypothetical protein ACLOJK_003824 [Asimina triloba]